MATTYLRVTSSRIVGEPNRKRRRIPVLADHFHQPAIFPSGISQANNDAHRPASTSLCVAKCTVQARSIATLRVRRRPFSTPKYFTIQFGLGAKVASFSRSCGVPKGNMWGGRTISADWARAWPDMLTPMRSSPHELRPSMRSVDARASLYDF